MPFMQNFGRAMGMGMGMDRGRKLGKDKQRYSGASGNIGGIGGSPMANQMGMPSGLNPSIVNPSTGFMNRFGLGMQNMGQNPGMGMNMGMGNPMQSQMNPYESSNPMQGQMQGQMDQQGQGMSPFLMNLMGRMRNLGGQQY